MFWERFLAECERKGLAPNAAAKEIPVSSASITKWKDGTQPNGTTLKKIASYFGVTADYLLGNSVHRTREEAADAFQITADRAVEAMIEWLEDNDFEVGSDYSDNGSGTTWYISKDGNITHYEENDFRLQAVNLAEIIQHSDNFVYLTWASSLFNEPPIELSEDEEELIDIFRELNRPAIHELMAKAYELRERVAKEKRSSQKKATG